MTLPRTDFLPGVDRLRATMKSGRDDSDLPPSLDGRILRVVGNSVTSEVDGRTLLRCRQRGPIVTAIYRGGRIRAGFLIGCWRGRELICDYLQVSTDNRIDKGHSLCRVTKLPDGRLRMEENFTWESRTGGGLNVFEER